MPRCSLSHRPTKNSSSISLRWERMLRTSPAKQINTCYGRFSEAAGLMSCDEKQQNEVLEGYSSTAS